MKGTASGQQVIMEKLSDWSALSQDILTNSHSAVGVLNDILNYDKVENKSLHLELGIIPIWTLIERTCNEFQLQAKACKIKYTLDFCADDPTEVAVGGESEVSCPEDEENSPVTKQLQHFVNHASQLPKDVRTELFVVGDNARISQTLRNLVSNALKFTPEGGTLRST